MKEESDSNSEIVLAHHLLSPHNHLLTGKQESPPPLASSSPSPSSVSSVTSIAKVSSSTNGHSGALPSSSLPTPPLKRAKNAFDPDSIQAHLISNVLASLGNDLATAGLVGLSSISPEQQLLMTQIATAAMRNLSSTSSTRSKSSSSDGSNAGSPLSSLSLSVSTKSAAKPRAADSPGSGTIASTTSTREKVFVCQICNRSFGYKHVLQNHERTHTGEKPFECRECHKRFTRDHHLKTHMRLHTGEKPYHCTHCDRQFVQVANLRRHLRVHTGERPYACELCTSRFSDSNQLKAHMLIHKGEKPFECQKCLGRFRRRHHLMHHKCPKDEANAGKPRRGRRPRAYDQLQSSSPNSLSSSRPGSADELLAHLPLLAATAAVSSTTANSIANTFYNQNSKSTSSLPLLPHSGLHHPLASSISMPPNAHYLAEHNSPPKSRRKPRHTIRILSQPQHSDLFDDEDNVQTQPLNLSISPGLTTQDLASHLGLNSQRAYSNDATHEDVLDLSRSRSDAESEPEPIEEDEDDDDGLVKDDDMDDELDDVMLHHHNKVELKNGKASNNGEKRHLSFHEHYSSKHINDNELSTQLEKNNGLSLELAAMFNAQLCTNLKSNGVSRLKPNGDNSSASSEASIVKD